MATPWRDRPFLSWAREKGYPYYYTNESGLPDGCLKLHLGVLTAYVHNGKLVRLAANGEGRLIDQMMYEFSQLFALCGKHNAYLDQAMCHIRQTRSACS